MTKSRDTADILEDVKVDGNVTAVGQETLKDNTGIHNTGVGYRAMFNSSLSGSFNVALGNYNLYANTSGASNTALGYQSLFSNSTASNNTAVGYQSSYNNTTGSEITALGYHALYANTTGASNVAIGHASAGSNTTGASNVAIGRQSLASNTTASYNTAVGYQAMYLSNASGNGFNTSVGYASGYNLSTGVNNSLFGYNCGSQLTTGSKNSILGAYNGNQGGIDIRTSSNNIVLSDGDGNPRLRTDSSNRTKMGINLGTTSSGNNPVLGLERDFVNHNTVIETVANTTNGRFHIAFVNANGTVGNIQTSGSSTAYNTSSDHRLKENVVELTGATERLKQLNPSRFNFIADADTTVDGFIAHEVQAVVPEAITGTHNEVDDDGNPVYQGIDQSKLVPLLVATIQELEARITALENA